jgi:hypothetical protein
MRSRAENRNVSKKKNETSSEYEKAMYMNLAHNNSSTGIVENMGDLDFIGKSLHQMIEIAVEISDAKSALTVSATEDHLSRCMVRSLTPGSSKMHASRRCTSAMVQIIHH